MTALATVVISRRPAATAANTPLCLMEKYNGRCRGKSAFNDISESKDSDVQSVKINQERSGGVTLEVQRQVPRPRNALKRD